MSLPNVLHNDSIVAHIVTTGAPDDDGVPTSTTLDLPLVGCNVQAQSTSEVRDNSLEIATSYRVSSPDTRTGITAGTEITFRMTTPDDHWFVIGDVLEYVATGILDHSEFTITKRRG